MNLNLKNKTAFVCGSTQGIGKAAAIELATLGAKIVLIARNLESLKKAVLEINGINGLNNEFILADFSNPDHLKIVIHDYVAKNGAAHILVNNTGGPPAGKISDAKIEEFITAFNNHLICNHILTDAVLPFMKRENYGRIINIISTSVKQPLKGLGVSNTVRAAVANWAKTLSSEVAAHGITVNNVLPGATSTARLQGIISNKSQKLNESSDKITQEMLDEIPAGRFADAHEIAAAVAFLASPAAAYINGINLPVDGGRTGCL
ncbi:MAG TPA: SDR family oxidoreductase [Bacteroidia bacterium]|nr:SDR family oxidoreductase [Bacteroidia bacterium]